MRRRPRAAAAVLVTGGLAAAIVAVEMGVLSSASTASKPTPVIASSDSALRLRLAALHAELSRAGADTGRIQAEIAALQTRLAAHRSSSPVFAPAPAAPPRSPSSVPVVSAVPTAAMPTAATPTSPTVLRTSSRPAEDRTSPPRPSAPAPSTTPTTTTTPTACRPSQRSLTSRSGLWISHVLSMRTAWFTLLWASIMQCSKHASCCMTQGY